MNSKITDEKNILDAALGNSLWLNSKEAAAYLRISVRSLRNHVYRGEVPHYKFIRNLRFKRTELDRLIEKTKRG